MSPSNPLEVVHRAFHHRDIPDLRVDAVRRPVREIGARFNIGRYAEQKIVFGFVRGEETVCRTAKSTAFSARSPMT